MNRGAILVVDDDASLRRVMRMQLEGAGFHVLLAPDGDAALAMLEQEPVSLVITDLRMPGAGGLDLLRHVRQARPDTTVIIITAFGTVESAVEAMKGGAYDFVTKPIDYDALLLAVNRATERYRLMQEVRNLRSALDARYGFESLIGRSKAFLHVLDQASRVAQRDSTVLIQGETGTGKELLARAIHHNSRRSDGPFVTINCGAVPRDLIESELFGFTRGAFTGAHASKEGRVEMADGGTLFLDEVGELPVEVQVKLLRLLQHGEVEKIGATGKSFVDARVIAATHRNLAAMVEDGTFREDLYYRLAVVPLTLPPLRERLEDIPALVEHIFHAVRSRLKLEHLRMAPDLPAYFCNYRWPGNVRELENVIERMLALCPEEEVGVEDLPEMLRARPPAADSILLNLPASGISLEGVERELILQALQRSSWNQTQAAQFLDISRRTLIYRMEKFGLRPPDREIN